MTDSRCPLLLVGEAPNEATCGLPRLWLLPDDSGIPHAANRLLRFTGWTRRQYLAVFDRTNLLHRAPPQGPKGYEFPLEEGRAASGGIVNRAKGSAQSVLLLGKRASRCFSFKRPHGMGRLAQSKVEYLQWYWAGPHGWDDTPVKMAVLPHPSGINRWWNSQENRRRARRFFDKIIEHYGIGP